MTASVDGLIGRFALRSANRHTRRGFLGRVGGATAALATAGMVVGADDALAVCSGTTITCSKLYGAGHNYCSENTCTDGSWTVPPSSCDAVSNCGSNYTRWRDCCATSTCGCHTVDGWPSCCSGCIYNGGVQCTSAHDRVRCRYWGCV